MAFFNSTRTPSKRFIPPMRAKSIPRKRSKREQIPAPIITRGPFALIWVNPNPPERRRGDADGPGAA